MPQVVVNKQKWKEAKEGFGIISRACKAGALPAKLYAPCNCMILIVSLIEFRDNDYLLCWQVLSQTDPPNHRVQPAPCKLLTTIS